MVKLSVISHREVGDTLQDFEKRRYLILSALRAQKNLSTAAFFNMNSRNSIAGNVLVGSCLKRERSSKVSPTSLWRSVHKLFTHAFVLFIPQDKRINKQFEPFVNRTPKRGGRH